MIKNFIVLSCLPLIFALPVNFTSGCDSYDEFLTCYQPESEKHLFNGDVRMTEAQWIAEIKNIESILGNGKAGRGVLNTVTRWPNNLIPYDIFPNTFSASQIVTINDALRRIEEVSCFTFVPRTNHLNYIMVTGEYTGCWSYVGMIGGMQTLNLQVNGCVSKGIAMHEFLHAIGYHHMQTARTRNDFVKIHYENITPGKESNFNIQAASTGPIVGEWGIPYDYHSVMHYGAYAFSKNGLATIEVLEPGIAIGQRSDLSHDDILELNVDFCGHQPPITTTAQPSTTTHPSTTVPPTITTTPVPTTSTTVPPSPGTCPVPNCSNLPDNTRYPHANKNKYWTCSHGYAYEQVCPANLVWDVSGGTCNYSGAAACAA